jgi:hypothetical protein
MGYDRANQLKASMIDLINLGMRTNDLGRLFLKFAQEADIYTPVVVRDMVEEQEKLAG